MPQSTFHVNNIKLFSKIALDILFFFISTTKTSCWKKKQIILRKPIYLRNLPLIFHCRCASNRKQSIGIAKEEKEEIWNSFIFKPACKAGQGRAGIDSTWLAPFLFPKNPLPLSSTSLPHLLKPTLETLALCVEPRMAEKMRGSTTVRKETLYFLSYFMSKLII